MRARAGEADAVHDVAETGLSEAKNSLLIDWPGTISWWS